MPPAPRAETISYGPRRVPDGRVNRFAELYGRHVPTYGIGARALLLRRGIPVHQQRDRRVLLQFRVDQEAPIGGDVVLPPLLTVHPTVADARGQGHTGHAPFWHGHDDGD